LKQPGGDRGYSVAMRMIHIAITLALSMAIAGGQQKGTPGETLLGAALHQEEVEGNLEAAIASYRKFLASRPDGRQLAYFSRRGDFTSPGALYAVLMVRSLETGTEREVPFKPRSMAAFPVCWFPDGRSVLAQARDTDASPTRRFMQVDTQTGDARALREEAAPGLRPALSPDGKTLFFWEPDDPVSPKALRIMARQLETGKERELVKVSRTYMGRLACSRDSRWLAFVRPGGESAALFIVPVGGGETRELPKARGLHSQHGGEIAWTPDGRYLLVVRHAGPPQGKTQLWRVPVDGGDPQPVGPAMEQIHFPSVHPDGRRFSFTSGFFSRPEIWVMENFLPALRATR